MNILSRLPEIGTSIFSVMSRLALEEGAINLSQGFPDFDIDEELIRLVNKFMEDGYNQYAPMPGVLELRESISKVIRDNYGREVDPETEITITAGGTEAIFSSIAALINKGDEVIIFDPSYDCYAPSVRLSGGVPVHISLVPPQFGIDWDEVKGKISPRTKMIMINTPHNPSGAVFSESDMKTLEELALRNGVIILSDEVYERIIFDGLTHQSVLHYPGLASQSAAVFSFGKTFHATGWKVGYAIAPEYLTREIRKAHQFITFSVNNPIQMALSEYLAEPKHYLNLANFYQQKRDFFLNEIKGSSFEPVDCHGTYFQLLSYKSISDRPDTEMAEWLTRMHKVASIPVSVFYEEKLDNKLLRFCFAKGNETLSRAGEILRKV